METKKGFMLNVVLAGVGRSKLDSLLVKQEASCSKLLVEQLRVSDLITMTLDGWTSESKQSVYASNLTLDIDYSRKALLYDVRDFSADRHTGEFLAGTAASAL